MLLLASALTGCLFARESAPSVQVASHNVAEGASGAGEPSPALVDAFGAQNALAMREAEGAALAATGSGSDVPWSSREAEGTVTPGPLYYVNVRACRDLVYAAEIERQRITKRATLCRERDGRWDALN